MTDALIDTPDAATTAAATEADEATARVDTLREALDGAHVVMLTSEHEGMTSRPMTLLQIDDAGGLWFLVDAGEQWVQELADRPTVDVTADLHADGRWVSITGIGVSRDDRAAVEELWTPIAAAFWESKDDPTIRVLRVDPTVVDIWRSAPSALGRLFAIGKAVITGDGGEAGRHDRLVFADVAGGGPIVSAI